MISLSTLAATLAGHQQSSGRPALKSSCVEKRWDLLQQVDKTLFSNPGHVNSHNKRIPYSSEDPANEAVLIQ